MKLLKKFPFILQFVCIALFSTLSIFAAAGDVDQTFNASTVLPPSQTTLPLNIQTFVVQPDGKILVAGNFRVLNGHSKSLIARLNADGTIDTTFNPPEIGKNVSPDFNIEIIASAIYSIGLQSDGKIIIGGSFSHINNNFRASLARLNSDGSLDTSFNNLGMSNNVYDLEVLPDNKILIGGDFSFVPPVGGTQSGLCRLNADGTYDTTFNNGATTQRVRNVAALSNGKALVSLTDQSNPNNSSLYRINSNGTTDNTFFTGPINSGYVETITVQPDGKVLIGGTFSGINGFAQGRMARLEMDGSVDVGFATTGAGANGNVFEIIVGAGGKIFVGGSFSSFNGAARQRIAKLNNDGTIDNSFTFNTDLLGSVFAISELSNGKVVVGGDFFTSFTMPLSPSQPLFLNANGTIDNSTFKYIGSGGIVTEFAIQTDGKILAGGRFTIANNTVRNNLARFNADGTLDTSFVPFASVTSATFSVTAIATQSDGKVVAGTTGQDSLVRLNADGSKDSTFNTGLFNGGYIADMTLLPDGKILAVGEFRRTFEQNSRYIARFNTNGSLDTSFAPALPNSAVQKILLQPDGKILIGGRFTTVGGLSRFRVARLNADGSVDTSFNAPGGANDEVYDLALQPDGKIVLVGRFTALNGSNSRKYVGRLNSDGTLDTSFSQTASFEIYTVEVETGGKILIGGPMRTVGGVSRSGLARLNSNGTIDESFQVGTGTNFQIHTIALQTDGKIMVGGAFSKYKDMAKAGIARLMSSAPVKALFDYDGDGRADVSVFRPSENRWYIFRSSDGVIAQTAFAISGDVPVPADFDGDSKTDIAIFRSSGDWWSLSSSNNAQITTNLGNANDYKLPSDFDGDGHADYVIFRPSNNTWYRLSSATGISSNVTFGLAGDKPVSGDFDGDGKSDVAIYRPSTGDWWYQSSINGAQLATRWGISTDIPTPADYDGDGKTDFAVYRPSTGVWYIYNSSTGNATIMAFGLSEDKPVAADYDGDGKADIAVFRPSTGIWYLMRSTAGFTALQFGVSTDIPTQNAFVP